MTDARQNRKSRLAAIDPRAKLFVMVVSSGAAIFSENPRFLFTVLIFLLLALALGGADARKVFTRARSVYALVAAIFAIQSIFAFRADALSAPLLAVGEFVVVYKAGFWLAVVLALRLLIVVISAQILLEGETRDYLLALVQLRLPYELAFLVTVGLHFLPILRAEAISVYQCIQLRGVAFKGVSLFTKFKRFAALCLPIFISTLRRAEEMSTAMELRGFRARSGRSSMRRLRFQKTDAALMTAWAIVIAGLWILSR